MGKIVSNRFFHIVTFSFLLLLSLFLNMSISLSQICFGTLLLCFIIYLIDTKYNIFIKDIYFILFMVYWLSAFLTAMFACEYVHIGKTLKSPWTMLVFFVSFYFIDKKYIKYIILSFAIGILILSLSNCYYYLFFSDNYEYFRGYSIAGGYMLTANLLAIDIIFLVAIILTKLEKNKYLILFYCFIIIISFYALLITATRMPLIATIITIALMFIIKLRVKGFILAILLLISLLTYVFTNDYVLARFDSLFSLNYDVTSSNGWRLLLWKNGFEVFKDYPIFGIGVGSYKVFMKEMMPPQNIGLPYAHAHNSYLMQLFTFGIFGLIVFCLFYGKILYDFIKNIFKSPYSFVGFFIMVTYLIQALTEYNTGMSLPSMQALFLAGIMLGLMKKESVL